ncbi:MAG: metallophosphoesterase family protein [Solirubrobacteraceae bacterium]
MAFGRRKRTTTSGTRVFFCTDLHGSDVCFKKFVNAADFYGTQILIMGGDVTGKMVVPIARQPSGAYLTSFAGEDLEFTSDTEVASFKKQLGNMGFYPALMDEEEFREIRDSQDKQDQLFKELIRVRLVEWLEYADSKLRGTGVDVFAAPGNDDFFEVDELLNGSDTIELLEMKVHRLTDEHEIITSGWTNPTPWNTERECPEDELAARLESMFEKVEDMERCIFNIHVPPNNSKIDICPKLDENMKVVYDMGNPVMAPAGSTAVREAIERLQPLVGLHGHIHEGRGETKIGRTVCLNPGSVYSEGVLNGVLLTLADGHVKDYQFTQG